MKIKRNQKGLGLSSSKGFTLIEVVLVLAIGGLIFLLAFLAFQQVSRNRRDTERRSAASQVVAELQNYAGDNSNNFPTSSVAVGSNVCTGGTAPAAGSFQAFIRTYMCSGSPAEFNGPQGAYTLQVSTTAPTKDQIRYINGENCDGDSVSGSVRVDIGLEAGSVCRDNQ